MEIKKSYVDIKSLVMQILSTRNFSEKFIYLLVILIIENSGPSFLKSITSRRLNEAFQ